MFTSHAKTRSKFTLQRVWPYSITLKHCERQRLAMQYRSNPQGLALDHAHWRAICDEIGERLGQVLKPEALEIPERLRALLERLAELEHAPSIVPSSDEMSFPPSREFAGSTG